MRLNLWTYLFVCLGLIAVVPSLGLGGVLTQRAEALQVAQSDRETTLAAEAFARETARLMLAHTNAVRALSRQVETAGTLDPDVLQDIVTAQHAAAPSLGNMWVANAAARSVANDPPFDAQGKPNAGTDYSDRDYYKKVLATNDTAYSRAQLGRTTGRPNLQVVDPIRDAHGSFIGFSQGAVDLGEIQELADRILAHSPGLRAVALDGEGRVIAHPDPLARTEMRELGRAPLYRPTSLDAGELRTGEDENGVAMRAAAAGIMPGVLNWTVVVTRSEADVQAHAADIRRETLITAGSALLAGLMLAGVLAAVQSRLIVRLAQVAAAVGRGDFTSLPPRPRRWHPREVGMLSTALKEMMMQLRARTEGLEQQVDERTAELRAANGELDARLQDLQEARDLADAAQQRYKSLFEYNPDFVYACDLNGKFLSANPACEEITGYSVDELVHISRISLVVPEDRSRALEHFRQAAEGEPQTYEISLFREDGRRINLHETIMPIIVGGSIVGVYGIAKDVTERNALVAEVARLEVHRETDRLKTEFVSFASREFLTPLHALVGLSELLLRADADEAQRRRWTEMMHTEATGLSQAAEGILNASRIEDGQIVVKSEPLEVEAQIGRTLASFQIQGSTHRLEQRCHGTLPSILADPDKLVQVLSNLVSNAIKYSPDGGTVTVAAEALDDKVHLSVADEGLGLPPEELPRLFGRFHRIMHADSPPIQGSGLGLYIARQLVDLMGGRIWAESPGVGLGSTFHVELPTARTEMRAA